MLETPLALLCLFVLLYYSVGYMCTNYRRKYCMLYMRAYGTSTSDVIDDVT